MDTLLSNFYCRGKNIFTKQLQAICVYVLSLFSEFFMTITAPRNASSRLKGIAKERIPSGKTPKFPTATHINTKPTNHERSVVCSNENFLDMMKIAVAYSKDQIPQTAPFIGSEGKIIPKP